MTMSSADIAALSRLDTLNAGARMLTACRHLFLVFVRSDDRIRNGLVFLATSEGGKTRSGAARLKSTPVGRRILERRLDVVAQLKEVGFDLPPASLGRCYAEFMQEHALTEDAYITAVEQVAHERGRCPDEIWFRIREGRLHDMRHVVTGYGPDELGEVCLLAFRCAQTGHAGMGLLTALAVLRQSFLAPLKFPVLAATEAFGLGRRCRWLDGEDWNDRLGEPLEAVREVLGLRPPRFYRAARAE